MNPRVQAAAAEALQQAIDTLGESGLQVVAIHRGEVVADAWAGIADPATGRPVDGDTLFTIFSMSKGVTATVVHRLVEKGVLAYDAHGKGERPHPLPLPRCDGRGESGCRATGR